MAEDRKGDEMTIEWLLLGLLSVFFAVWLIGRWQKPRLASSQFKGWARVSLLGRNEYVGAVHEVERNGETWIHVLTADGRTMRTQPGAVYSIEHVPFGVVEEDVVRAVELRNSEVRRLSEQRDHALDAVDARDARIEKLRKQLELVHENLAALGPEPGSAIEDLKMHITQAIDDDAAEDCPF